MTSAEARNADATVAEFREQLTTVLNDAHVVGVPREAIIFWLKAWTAIEEKELAKESG